MTGRDYYRLASSVMDEAVRMRPLWMWLARHIMPRTEDAVRQVEPNAGGKREVCTVAAESMHTLAAAHYSYITPSGMPWFKFRSRDEGDEKNYWRWYARASQVALQELSKSNFYAEVQECYLSRVLYGTSLLLCEARRGGGLIFRNVPVGSFGIAENADGVVDTVVREFEFTAAQAVERWGRAVPHEVERAYDRPESRFRDKFKFLHLVTPRREYATGNGSQGGVPSAKRRFASVYMYAGGNHDVLEVGGYEEFPYLATRFLKWPGTAWGYAPGCKCMSSIASLMKLENNMDILSDLAVFPRIFMLPEQTGEVDYRPGGETVVSELAAQFGYPREWGTQGDFRVGKDLIAEKEEKVRSAFLVPFLQVISSVDRTMTATEVNARQEEHALSISPTFAQFTADMDPFLYRIFCVLFRQGRFNAPDLLQPEKLRVPDDDGTENFSVAVPEVCYLGRISQAIDKSLRMGLEGFVQTMTEYVHGTGDVSAFDYIDTGRVFKHIFETSGAPYDVLRDDGEVEQIRARREQLELLQAQAQAAAAGAGAAKDLNGAGLL